jgi:hypothetical protein
MVSRRLTALVLLVVVVLSMATPTIALACEGEGGGGHLEAEPMTLNFGEVTLTESKTLKAKFKELFAPLSIKEVLNVDAPSYEVVKENCKGKTLQPNETCEIEVKFAPVFQGNRPSTESVKSSPSGEIVSTLFLEGFGRNLVSITPTGGLKWASKEEGTKEFAVTTISPIEITAMSPEDTKDFSIPETSGCKKGAKITRTTPCNILVKRITDASTGEKVFSWKYKEEDGSTVNGPGRILEGK